LRCNHEFVDTLLKQAMEPILRDLAGAGIAAPRVDDDDWADDPDSVSAMLWSHDGSGTGVRVSRSASAFERIAAIADQVQEWAIHELWPEEPTNWPPCRNHPNGHPLEATSRAGAAVWACPADNTAFSPIGAL
jgi:hypothetical protein